MQENLVCFMGMAMLSEIKGGELVAGLSAGIFLTAVSLVVPLVILYFVIKLAVKNAIKELREENIL